MTGWPASIKTETSRPASGPRTWPTFTTGASPAALPVLRHLLARVLPVTIPNRRARCDTLVARTYLWKHKGGIAVKQRVGDFHEVGRLPTPGDNVAMATRRLETGTCVSYE